MRVPPPGFGRDDVATALRSAWEMEATDVRYLPVGFGSHHYLASRGNDDPVFVTVDFLDPTDPGRQRELLCRAFATALALSRLPAGTDVVAPIPTRDGRAAADVTGPAVLTVFPHIPDAGHVTTATATSAQEHARIALLDRLHAATDHVRDLATVDDLAIDARAHLEAAMNQLDAASTATWAAGPRSRHAQELLGPRRGDLRAALRGYDRLAAKVATGRADWVVTHGEPHWQNVLDTGAGLRLIDWDTVRIGPAARDVWMIVDDDEGVRRYTERTGRAVPPDELLLYRVNWELTEIALYTRWFREPHEDDEDTGIAWESYGRYLAAGSTWEQLR